jgi:hypothetical protein
LATNDGKNRRLPAVAACLHLLANARIHWQAGHFSRRNRIVIIQDVRIVQYKYTLHMMISPCIPSF